MSLRKKTLPEYVAARVEQGYTQTSVLWEIAEKAGVSYGTVHRVAVHGRKTHASTARKLSEATRVPMASMLRNGASA